MIFTLSVYTHNDFNIKIIDAKKKRFEVPQEEPFPIDPSKKFSFPLNLANMIFSYTSDPFDFKIHTKSDYPIFSTYDGDFVFSEYYLEITTKIYGYYMAGLGERFNSGFRLKEGKWTIFNRGRGKVID